MLTTCLSRKCINSFVHWRFFEWARMNVLFLRYVSIRWSIPQYMPFGVFQYMSIPPHVCTWLCLVGSIKLQVSFAKEPFKRANNLQKRPIILLILLIVATPYPSSLSLLRKWQDKTKSIDSCSREKPPQHRKTAWFLRNGLVFGVSIYINDD